jgi:exonuclease SbcC
MRPIRLIMERFGAFPDRVEVDFERLSHRGLFLIAGETGAGKSTILDGVFGALFGKTAGDERTLLQDMVSHHRPAAGAGATMLQLDFRLGARSFRVTRSWRETGNQRARLAEIDPAGAEVDGSEITGVRDVEARIHSLLGLGPEEFRRVCLLPQEKIRNAITADGKERREMLLRLFDATRFDDIVGCARRMLGDASRSMESADAAAAAALEHLGLQAGDDADAVLARARTDLNAARDAEESARQRTMDARSALDQHKALETRFRQYDRDIRRHKMLQRHVDVYCDAISRRIVQAKRVASLCERLEERDQASKQFERLSKLRASHLEESTQAGIKARRLEERSSRISRLLETSRIAAQRHPDALAARARWNARSDRRNALRDAIRDVNRLTAGIRSLAERVNAERKLLDTASAALKSHETLLPASRLAEGLAPGSACPVCGSTDHPAPAIAPDARAGELLKAEHEEQRWALEQAQHKRSTAEGALRTREHYVQEASDQDRLDAETSDEDWDLESRAMERQAWIAARASRWVGVLMEAKSDLDGRARDLRNNERHDAQMSEHYGGECVPLEGKLTDLNRAIAAMLQQLQLASEDDARRLHLPEERVDRLGDLVARRRADREALKERIASTEAEGIPARPGDAAELERESKRAAADESVARETFLRANTRAAVLEDRVPKLKILAQAQVDAREAHARLKTLVDALEGRLPGMTIGLRDYAVNALFERALAHASGFLDRMGGRYRLVARQGRGYGGVAETDLEVIDAYTDRPRSPESLSGGEGFLAALALALGLSEAVRQAAGGVRLDALFIDEGFGSLDPSALEDAVSLLNSVRTDERMVGVISHVAAMQEQVDAQLRVMKSRTGSSVEHHGC